MDLFETLTGIFTVISFLGLSGMLFITNKSISKILEQSPEILFGYYSKMKVYLLELKATLGQENETPLLSTLVKRDETDDSVLYDDESVKKFQDVIDKIVDFFKSQDWQIPLDFEFEKALSDLLLKIMYLEEGNICQYNSTIEEVKKDYQEMVKLIDCLIKKINDKQNEITTKVQKKQEGLFDRWLKK